MSVVKNIGLLIRAYNSLFFSKDNNNNIILRAVLATCIQPELTEPLQFWGEDPVVISGAEFYDVKFWRGKEK